MELIIVSRCFDQTGFLLNFLPSAPLSMADVVELSVSSILQHREQPASWWLQQLHCDVGDTRAIERAIRKVALRVHPDQNNGSAEASEATNILMHPIKDMLLAACADTVDDAHVASYFRSSKPNSRQSEQMQMDEATRRLKPNSVAWATALAKVCSYNAGHYLSSAYTWVQYKRSQASDAALALAADMTNADALTLFQVAVADARVEGAAWNAAVLPYRAAESPLNLGRLASAYDRGVVHTSPLFADSPEWVNIERELALAATARFAPVALQQAPVANDAQAHSTKKRQAAAAAKPARRTKQKTSTTAAHSVIDLTSSGDDE